MKIKSVAISNLLSFKFESDLAKCPIIEFDEGLNILVGPNGSGKSNFLEIINHLFSKALFKAVNYEEDRVERFIGDADYTSFIKNTISLTQTQHQFSIAANVATPTSPSTIRIRLSFSEEDRNNMQFVLKNSGSINAFVNKY